MEVVFYFSCLLLGCLIGSLIGLKKTKCNHKWELIQSGNIMHFHNGIKVITGFIKIYECEHCKKLKKQKVDIND